MKVLTAASNSLDADEICISFYELEIPAFIGKELERLYENIHSCIAYFELHTSLNNINTYVVQKNGKIITIFLFEYTSGKIEVLNKFITVDPDAINRFAHFIFNKYVSAAVITFPTIQTVIEALPFPFRQATLTDDFVVTLPDTVEQYDACLGKSTRRAVHSGMKKFKNIYSTVSINFYINEDIDEQHIRCIADLYKARLKAQKVSFDPWITERRIELAKKCGTMVGVIMVDGRICAGSITYRVGNNYFASMLAHDPDYNGDRVGFLCAYHTVCESIARGGKEFHFGQSRFRYKKNLLCVQRNMNRVEIYRSTAQLLMNYRRVAKMALNEKFQQLELWSKDPRRQNSIMSRFIAASLSLFRRLYKHAKYLGANTTPIKSSSLRDAALDTRLNQNDGNARQTQHEGR